jgi:hypothetical protein
MPDNNIMESVDEANILENMPDLCVYSPKN